jgi:hypothetical protein
VKSRLILALTAALAITLAVVPSALRTAHAGAATGFSVHGMNKIQKRLLSGFASFEAGIGVPAHQARAHVPRAQPGATVNLCPSNHGSNVLVNQNCLNVSDPDLQGRGQANNETAIAQNPRNPRQIVAGNNDYRRGDSTCGPNFSRNGGATWTDSTMPDGFTRGTAFGGVAREYWQASGDPSVAWDSRGNAYYACLQFSRGQPTTNNSDFSSAVYVYRSTGDGGASWNFPGRPVVETFTRSTTGVPLTDKPYIAVDSNPASPFRDRIYVTWTQFAADGTAYIYEVHSNDYGQTFSSPVVVSTDSTSLCANTLGQPTPQGNCNANQFSDPFIGPDGALYVAFDNTNVTNSGGDNHFQVLLTRSTDGGQTFSAPAKVGNYYELPDCLTYQDQDAFVGCVPEKGSAQNSVFRAANYPSGAVNPRHPSQVVVTYGSYINRDSNESNGCVPAGFNSTTNGSLYTGVKTTGACNNKIVLSASADGGATFAGSTTDPRNLPVVNTAPGQARTDQWFQWAAFTPRGSLAASYYDRQYGSAETNGDMDISASTSKNLARFKVRRVTSSSMPLPTQFTDAQGNGQFFGDYSGLAAQAGLHPLWMDTRSPDAFVCSGTGVPGVPPALCPGVEPNGLTANDQNIFTRTLSAP